MCIIECSKKMKQLSYKNHPTFQSPVGGMSKVFLGEHLQTDCKMRISNFTAIQLEEPFLEAIQANCKFAGK